ncbi:uncharacterized protein EV420DRAFT_1524028 [Desarmillaria tabescens]|uniref:Uncharacterized protein n=1 Tax=Armillaria tabescens TaxID=1929756 RepID=A0AA39NB09_ARMTA|nr:uncharacterized protein EV420DRAFT_1524028 [Desarmillaria tabescens]KAK0462331.1 hypothetical protein EV420DRAFT_1524028 [Desarmillaria tabescens]
MRSPAAVAGMMLHHASLTLTLHFGVFRTRRDGTLMVQVGRLRIQLTVFLRRNASLLIVQDRGAVRGSLRSQDSGDQY